MKIDNERIDNLILSYSSSRWQKAAKIVASVIFEPSMKSEEGVDDQYIFERIKVLVFNNKLESQGSLENMRYCEIRNLI